MSVPSAYSIVNMGFSFQMFGFSSEADLNLTIKDALVDHGHVLSGRIGVATYASTEQPISTYVKKALSCLVAADLCQMRINRLAQEVKQEDGSDAKKMRQQRADYLNDAEKWIGKIEALAATSNDFAVGCVTSSHFEEL